MKKWITAQGKESPEALAQGRPWDVRDYQKPARATVAFHAHAKPLQKGKPSNSEKGEYFRQQRAAHRLGGEQAIDSPEGSQAPCSCRALRHRKEDATRPKQGRYMQHDVTQ